MVKKQHFQATGKRKRAIARVVLCAGKGIVRINHQLLDTIKPDFARSRIMEPLLLSDDAWKKLDFDVNVHGGGWQGQIEATRSAIARVLVEHNKKLRKTFLDYDRHLLIWDIRQKEQRKPNDSRARAARQKSYR